MRQVKSGFLGSLIDQGAWLISARSSRSLTTGLGSSIISAMTSTFEPVYCLRDDKVSIESMQRTSQSDGPYGLRMTHGLVGSNRWWTSQADGTLPVSHLHGVISGFWPGQRGDGPAEFALRQESGDVSQWLCNMEPKRAARLFQIGRLAAVTFVEQELKTAFAGSSATKVVTMIALGPVIE